MKKNYSKRVCILVLLMFAGAFSSVISKEPTIIKAEKQINQNVEDGSAQGPVLEEKIKANKATLDRAQDCINNKDFISAIRYLDVYISEKPKKYEGYKLRGDAYYALRRYDLAKNDYQVAVDIKFREDKIITNTKYVSAIILGADKGEQLQNAELGELYGRLMYAQKALNDPAYATSYENAIKYNSHIYLPKPNKIEILQINSPQKYAKILNPKGIDEEIKNSIEYIEKENYNEALYQLQKVTSEYPNYFLGYYLSGVALSGLEKYEDAQKSFEKSLALNPYDFESYASLGQIYFDKAETSFSSLDAKKSIEYFKKALALNPNCSIYYFYIALNELQLGNANKAIKNFNIALSLNPNDYNSMYYKLIAQFEIGDYSKVVDDATVLLYKHVSNYNSVLYIRSLAYLHINEYSKAFNDLISIQNSIEDIYNTDVKTVSDKEKTLGSYVYYLKSEMEHSRGYGAASDVDKAMKNPIIQRLSKAEKSLLPYKNVLNKDRISLADYKKFEAFYNTSLPKLLSNGLIITEKDIDNQYDYIRTTFSDLGLSFVYLNPNYKIDIIPDYPFKKYASKLSAEDFEKISSNYSQEDKDSAIQNQKTEVKYKSTNEEIIGDTSATSLAQILANNALVNKISTEPKAKAQVISHNAEEKSSNIASGDSFVIDDDNPLIKDKNAEHLKNIIEEEKNIQDGKLLNTDASEKKQSIKNNKSAELTEISNKNEIRLRPSEVADDTKIDNPVKSETGDVDSVDTQENELESLDSILQTEIQDEKQYLKEKLKLEKAQAKAEAKLKKMEEKAQKQQLKMERAQAKAEAKRIKQEKKQQLKDIKIQKKIEKTLSDAEKPEVEVSNQDSKKSRVKDFISNFKDGNSESENTQKTIIKSLDRK